MLTWSPLDRDQQVAFRGPLTLLIRAHRVPDPARPWNRIIIGWSWRFGPTPEPVMRTIAGVMLATVAGTNEPIPEGEAKRECEAAALAYGEAIVRGETAKEDKADG